MTRKQEKLEKMMLRTSDEKLYDTFESKRKDIEENKSKLIELIDNEEKVYTETEDLLLKVKTLI